MTTDIVQELGLLTLGTRFRRLGERLQAQTQAILETVQITVPASHLPVLAALDQLGSLTVGDIADAVGISQPAVTRQLSNLETAGLVISQHPPKDQRSRTLVLTKAGQTLMAKAKQSCWLTIEASVQDACGSNADTLLMALTALEQALVTESLDKRSRRLSLQGDQHAPT